MKKEPVRPVGIPVPRRTFASAVRAGPWVFTAGVLATDFDRGIPASLRTDPAMPFHSGQDRRMLEAEYIFQQLDTILKAAGSQMELGVRTDQFSVSHEATQAFQAVTRNRIRPPWPATGWVEVRELAWRECLIEVEMIAVTRDSGIVTEAIDVNGVPTRPAGIRAGDFIFLTGRVATDSTPGLESKPTPSSASWQGSTIDLEVRHILQDVKLILEAAGSSLESVIKAQVSLVDLADVGWLDGVWREFFPTDPPARTIVPLNFNVRATRRVEISIIALRGGGSLHKEVIEADDLVPRFHESAVVRAGELVFLSGLVAADRKGLLQSARVDANYTGIGVRRQLDWILSTANQLLRGAGSSIGQAVRIENYLTDLHDLPLLIRAYEDCFGDNPPAIMVVGVPPLYVPGCSVLMDIWAVVD
jgi:enamine deaminase RidA (YjgF/YER057c/UK114 family)